MKKRQRKKNEKRYKQEFVEEIKKRFGDPPYDGIAAIALRLQTEQRQKNSKGE